MGTIDWEVKNKTNGSVSWISRELQNLTYERVPCEFKLLSVSCEPKNGNQLTKAGNLAQNPPEEIKKEAAQDDAELTGHYRIHNAGKGWNGKGSGVCRFSNKR